MTIENQQFPPEPVQPLETELTVKVNPKVGLGLSSVAGFLLAGAQYVGVLVGLVDDGALSIEELGVLATATATLVATINGRMKQAAAAIGGTPQV